MGEGLVLFLDISSFIRKLTEAPRNEGIGVFNVFIPEAQASARAAWHAYSSFSSHNCINV